MLEISLDCYNELQAEADEQDVRLRTLAAQLLCDALEDRRRRRRRSQALSLGKLPLGMVEG